MVWEDLVAPTSNLGILFVGFVWSCASFLPLCVGWDALLLHSNTAHRSNLRRMLTRSFPVTRNWRHLCRDAVLDNDLTRGIGPIMVDSHPFE